MEAAGENCGIIAAVSLRGLNVVPLIYWGLVALNHRGQQSYGISTYNRGLHLYRRLGLASSIGFSRLKGLVRRLAGGRGIGHVRYATSGGLTRRRLAVDAQPHLVERGRLTLSVAYNGNIANTNLLRERLTSKGVSFSGTSDAEVLAHLLLERYAEEGSLIDGVREVMREVDGAYSVVGLTGDGVLFSFRDPNGIRPLVWGGEDVVAVASESVALDVNGIPFGGFVEPGELILVDDSNVERFRLISRGDSSLCAFEYAYFSRPDSRTPEGKYVYEVRRELGRRLAMRYHEVSARVDVIVPVPQTAMDAAYGFHEESGKPIEPVIFRNRYVTQRAFIMAPTDRELIISRKYNMLLDRVSGLRVALIDDSIVRGDTLRHVVECLRRAGAREVHVFSTFPKIVAPCFYGVDMATYGELIGFNRNDQEVARALGADTVNYQTIDDFYASVGSRNLCLACVTGEYPTPYARRIARRALKAACEGLVFKGRIVESLRGESLCLE